ncbi:MAG: bifunctional glutamate N-acetyltransferase/amino-acid acetyltransferase ArgJ [Proteobacteria bacterium]|nr:bifunctional glutamate N-acetyltransferase/amino-acid acetyltransferase ArgJ [Pseudomonadota bacterium]
MSVGLKYPDSILPIDGIRLAGVSAGLYEPHRLDLALIEITDDSVVSAVFTKNLFCAAPVDIAKDHLKSSSPRYCLVNSGNANAGNGQQGIDDANRICEYLAGQLSCKKENILPFSTGVIGESLPVNKIENVIPELIQKLKAGAWLDSAQAIMTTDTIPKAISTRVNIGNTSFTITGIAKGAGMIKPNMATMLAFIATDAKLSDKAQNKLLKSAVEKSFNRITVDGDTSTNDACVLISTGKADNKSINTDTDEYYVEFEKALVDICCKLAQAIIRDGEGATKFIEIEVNEGKSSEECLMVAYQIAESPLVKTAFTASDPNWGRILAAVGAAGTSSIEMERVSIYLDDLCIVRNGERDKSYTEEKGKKVMQQEDIKISVNLSHGAAKETIWTTDLSYEYIKINAEYRT